MSSLQPVRAESLSAQVAESIREAIFSGELKPGQVLRELGLARNMNVSQATVREALSHLEHYGLVVRTPNRSTSVTSLTQEEIQNRASIWLTLESTIWEHAASAQSELLTDLNNILASMEDSSIGIARRFHLRLWESTGNAVLIRILDQLTTPLFAFCRIDSNGTSAFAGRYHAMVNSVQSGDLQSCRQALRDQVQAIEQAISTTSVVESESREAVAGA